MDMLMDKDSANKRALLLILCTFSYLMLGAAVFGILESENDSETREMISYKKELMMAKLVYIDLSLRNCTYLVGIEIY